MKFKYYLRGAGIGIVVATVILSAVSLFQDNMSDAEVIQRAMELGMVMEEGTKGTLADLPGRNNIDSNVNTRLDDENSQTDVSDGETNIDDVGGTDNQTTQPEPSTIDETDTDHDANTKQTGTDDTKQQVDKTQDTKKEKVTVTIEGGDVSRAVSQKVYDAGLVDDAEEFNDYLGDNDYDNLLQPGTYQIKKGSSFQQIAEILTKK